MQGDSTPSSGSISWGHYPRVVQKGWVDYTDPLYNWQHRSNPNGTAVVSVIVGKGADPWGRRIDDDYYGNARQTNNRKQTEWKEEEERIWQEV